MITIIKQFNYNNTFSLSVVLMITLLSCTSKKQSEPTQSQDTLKYATGFSWRSEGNIKYVTVNYPYQGATEGYQYVLVPNDEEVPAHDNRMQVIRTPIKTIVCTSTTHIPL